MKFKCLILLLIFSGCGILNRSTRNTSKDKLQIAASLKEKNSADLLHNNNFEQSYLSRDSMRADHHLRLYPNGVFNFAADGSFSGQFDSILMSVTNAKVLNASQKISSSSLSKAKFSKESEAELNEKSTVKKTSRVTKLDTKSALVLLVILLLVMFYLKKRFYNPSE
jgi:hypothetical protein